MPITFPINFLRLIITIQKTFLSTDQLLQENMDLRHYYRFSKLKTIDDFNKIFNFFVKKSQ